ncbi:hypothetical protein HWV62_18974 [Athelia sp. TMB]|nr:hypothetical protein HWV62_18974 [Athelia sp. TMB]
MLQQASSTSNSGQSNSVSPVSSVPSLSTPHSQPNWPPRSTPPALRLTNAGQMGQTLGRADAEPAPPPVQASATPFALASKGFKFRNAFGSRRKQQSEEATPPSTPASATPFALASKGFKFRNAFGSRRKQQSEEATPPSTPVTPTSLNGRRSRGIERSSSDAPNENTGVRRPTGAGHITSPISTTLSAKQAAPIPQSTSSYSIPAIPPMPAISSINASPLVPPTPSFPITPQQSRSGAEKPVQEPGNQRRVLERVDQEKANTKEIWRKSDSNMSFNTIRPELASVANRSSRPVSMAESLQSTHTIIAVNKRLSALLSDSDFVMAEEDQGSAGAGSGSSSPHGSFRSKKRRSSSLSFTSPFPRAMASTSTHDEPQIAARSKSENPRLSPKATVTDGLALNRAAVGGYISPIVGNSATQSAGNNIQERLAVWSATSGNTPSTLVQTDRRPPVAQARDMRPPPTNPYAQAAPPPARAAAISITSGFGPAARLAKRATERIGRAWGMHSGSNTSMGYVSSSSASTHSSQQSMEDVRSPTPPVSLRKKHQRTPGGASGAWSVHSSSTSSTSETGSFHSASGSFVGKCMRGPLRSEGGVVFGRDLKTCVAETALQATPSLQASNDRSPHRRTVSGSKARKEAENSELEARRVPALVVRCAQHILSWGVQEEGADYDLSDCHLGDLDPHAVASVFKAYIRELPEPILTHALVPYFEAAITTETQHRQSQESERPAPARVTGSLRKPPSLSTLAMPDFNNMRPPSANFVGALRSLISALPEENRDLLRTTIELIKATAKRSKETKMPLSNLLLIFCPSMNMNPPLLRALCEAEDIWDGHASRTDVNDIKRQLTVKASNISREDSSSSFGSSFSISSDDFDDALGDDEGGNNRFTMISDHAPTPTLQTSAAFSQDPAPPVARARPRGVARRAPVSTLYLDTASADDLSLQSFGINDEIKHSDIADFSRSGTTSPVSPDTSNPLSPPSLSSSMDSLTSSEAPSSPHLPLSASTSQYAQRPPVGVKSATMPLMQISGQSTPNVSEFGVVQFPSAGSPPATPMKNRPSMPHLTPAATIQSSSSPPSLRTRRLKKPSLHLLFSRRSSVSLNALSTASISAPIPHEPGTPSTSNSSSTPVSSTDSSHTRVSIASSEPPVLDLALETEPLDLKQYLAAEKRRTMKAAARHRVVDSFYTARESPSPSEGLSPLTPSPYEGLSPSTPNPMQGLSPSPAAKETPIADFYSTPSCSVISFDAAQNVQPLRVRPRSPRARPSQSSIDSTASFNHLSMALPDESLIEDDWAQSVIAASENEGGWKNMLKLFG